MQNVKLVVLLGRWDRNLLLPEDSTTGSVLRKLPGGTVRPGESVRDCAGRIVKQYGLTIPPHAWVSVPESPADPKGLVLLVVRAPNDAIEDQTTLANRKVWSQAELALCDAWVNPGKFEAGIMSSLERARKALDD